MSSSRRRAVVIAFMLVGACASRPATVPIAAVPAPAPVPVAPPLPAGASPGMAIPAALADGSYPTPNRGVSAAGAVWHLRAALNVAALACRGPAETAIVARYNALIAVQAKPLAAAETTLAAEYRAAAKASGGDWRDRYDDAMTRLYNFFSQAPARDGFCRAADAVLAEGATLPAGELGAFAAVKLPLLDAAFTDFYRAYDAWRRGRPTPLPVQPAPDALPPQVIALAAATSPRPAAPARPTAVTAPTPAPRAAPRLELDASVFAEP